VWLPRPVPPGPLRSRLHPSQLSYRSDGRAGQTVTPRIPRVPGHDDVEPGPFGTIVALVLRHQSVTVMPRWRASSGASATS
jgi:hypothetical protein